MVRRHVLIGLGLRKMNFRSKGLARLLKGHGIESTLRSLAPNMLRAVAPQLLKSAGPQILGMLKQTPQAKAIKALSFRY
jgi:hypothetical protein